eukprot:2597154-Pleurochrysis_carterae.AAC.1
MLPPPYRSHIGRAALPCGGRHRPDSHTRTGLGGEVAPKAEIAQLHVVLARDENVLQRGAREGLTDPRPFDVQGRGGAW